MSTARYRIFDPQPAEENLPEKFTFPHHYRPHRLAVRAAQELQSYLNKREWTHDFGCAGDWREDALGKMFGVLVVQTPDGDIGYLQAFSGRLEGTYDLPPFVPPVYDLYGQKSFFKAGEEELNRINSCVDELESSADLQVLRSRLAQVSHRTQALLDRHRQQMKLAKAERDHRRLQARPTEISALEAKLREESAQWRYRERDLKRYTRNLVARAQAWVNLYENEINRLRQSRKRKSAELQNRLFEQYTFLNYQGKSKGVGEIFAETPLQVPPSGAGECCAPKLLQYAFLHQLKPLCMAEFWWGQSPPDLIRHHGQYYPACRGKCEPILTHMLAGMELEANPLLQSIPEQELHIIYEDEYLLAIDKPAGLLSVPGRELEDSVWLRLKAQRPDETAPYSVHRLDMETSGILLLAKTAAAYKQLQAQFADRNVKKTYLALLEKDIEQNSGTIELSMRFDYLNRPRQIVVKNGGKTAITRYEIVKRYSDGRCLVKFFPLTGRTHQLRVHAAHTRGLAAPIVGDSLYGKSRGELKLRAEELVFEHPISGQAISLKLETDIDDWIGGF
ncbi:MAG: pseudouridine synthase [Bacteroidota bacterium]